MRSWRRTERVARAGVGSRFRSALAFGLVLSSWACEDSPRGEPARAVPASRQEAAAEPVVRGGFEAPEPGGYALPPLGSAADGDVLASDGAATTLHALFDDRVVLLSFIYRSCREAEGCPLATGVLQQAGREIRDDSKLEGRVRLLSLSFDPERDTPDRMHGYGEALVHAGHGHANHEGHHDAGDLDWHFLTTASEAALQPILDAYGQALTPEIDATGEPTGDIAHVLRVFLVDRERRIRNVYSTSFLDPGTLLADIRTVLFAAGERAAAADPGTPGAEPALHGPGDVRTGYEHADFTTRTIDLASRRGRPADLASRVAAPPLGLPPVPVPDDAPLGPAQVELGRRLFFDRRLSHNDTVSCALCHIPEQGFTNNELATAVGIEGRTVRRNSPTLYNTAYVQHLFHDGRETTLEHQVWGPLLARNEMGNPSIGAVVEKVRGLPGYAPAFEAAYPLRGLTMETLGLALAAYERTLVSGDSAFDRWRYGGEEGALGAEARRGFELFVGRAGCASCHTVGADHALFSDDAFHNTGVGYARSMGIGTTSREVQLAPGVFLAVDPDVIASVAEPRPNDLGRYEITRDPADRWAYRTPGLRNVALTAPYMHDGSLATLEDVVRFYDRGGIPNDGLDPRVRPLGLSDSEVADLVAFLESLTGSDVRLLVADAFAAPVGDVGVR